MPALEDLIEDEVVAVPPGPRGWTQSVADPADLEANGAKIVGLARGEVAGEAVTFGQLPLPTAIQYQLDGAGDPLTAGIVGDIVLPYGATITGWRILADQVGSIVINLWKDTYANYPPTVADKITASAPPTLSSVNKNEDYTLTGWTTVLAEGDCLRVNIDSVSVITRATFCLFITRDAPD